MFKDIILNETIYVHNNKLFCLSPNKNLIIQYEDNISIVKINTKEKFNNNTSLYINNNKYYIYDKNIIILDEKYNVIKEIMTNDHISILCEDKGNIFTFSYFIHNKIFVYNREFKLSQIYEFDINDRICEMKIFNNMLYVIISRFKEKKLCILKY